MAQEHINLGTPPTGVDGDTTRTAVQKCEDNFTDLYGITSAQAATIAANTASIAGNTASIAGNTASIAAVNAAISVTQGMKNKFLNANLDIWQRGTTVNVTAGASIYQADRWLGVSVAGSTAVYSQQAFVAGQGVVPFEPQFFMRHIVTSVAGAANAYVVMHRIENVRTLAGQTATLSFWAKADAVRNIAVEAVQNFGSGGSASITGINVTTVGLTAGWVKHTVQLAIPSIAGNTVGASSYLQIVFWLDAGSSYNSRTNALGQQSGTFDFAQLQLEQGATATTFDLRSVITEFELCQRYYEKSYDMTVNPGTLTNAGSGQCSFSPLPSATYSSNIDILFRQDKRATPTMTFYSPGTGAAGKIRDAMTSVDVNPSVGILSTRLARLGVSGSGAATALNILAHWTAEAEL